MSSTDTVESEENYTSRNMSINIAQGAKQPPANTLLTSANRKRIIGKRSKWSRVGSLQKLFLMHQSALADQPVTNQTRFWKHRMAALTEFLKSPLPSPTCFTCQILFVTLDNSLFLLKFFQPRQEMFAGYSPDLKSYLVFGHAPVPGSSLPSPQSQKSSFTDAQLTLISPSKQAKSPIGLGR